MIDIQNIHYIVIHYMIKHVGSLIWWWRRNDYNAIMVRCPHTFGHVVYAYSIV